MILGNDNSKFITQNNACFQPINNINYHKVKP